MNMHLPKTFGGIVCKDTRNKLGVFLSFQNIIICFPIYAIIYLIFTYFPIYMRRNTGVMTKIILRNKLWLENRKKKKEIEKQSQERNNPRIKKKIQIQEKEGK